MKWLAAIKLGLIALAAIVFSAVSFTSHASAMSHDMSDMNQSTGYAAACASLCRTAVMMIQVKLTPSEDEDDDEVGPRAFPPVQAPNWNCSERLVKQRLYAAVVKPPPKVPVRILYSVFRV